jgi:hypothetical protein
MGAQQKRSLRPLTLHEREELCQKATSNVEPVSTGKRAKALLAVANGSTFTEAGRQVAMSGDGVSQLVERFHHRGIQALSIAPGRGCKPTYTSQDHELIRARNTTAPHLGHRSVYGLVTFPFAKVLTLPRIFRHLPKNDPSGLTGTWMEVSADHTHLALHWSDNINTPNPNFVGWFTSYCLHGCSIAG